MSAPSAVEATPDLTRTRADPRPRPTSDFTALARQVQEGGWMRRRYAHYWTKLVGAVVLLVTWVVGFVWLGASWWQLVSAVVLSVLLTQIAFLGHDAAHRQIFASGRWNDWVSLIVANLFVGLSYGWWQSKHTRHHATPNQDGADPDIDLPALAFTPAQATRPRRPVLAWLVARQGWYFFPLLLLEGVSLHKDGLARVLGRSPVRRRWVELVLLGVRLGGLLALVLVVLPPGMAAAFMTVQLAAFGLYMGASFAPNHIGMPLVAPLVAAHCAAVGVPYTTTTLWQSYGIVVRHLNTVGLQGNDPFLCPLIASRRAL